MSYMEIIAVVALLMTSTITAHAHTPLCACFDNSDDTITCEGSFSDGSSAAGVTVSIEKLDGTVLLEGTMNEDSEFTFDKPEYDYTFVFDAGDAHIVKILSKEIIE